MLKSLCVVGDHRVSGQTFTAVKAVDDDRCSRSSQWEAQAKNVDCMVPGICASDVVFVIHALVHGNDLWMNIAE